MKEIQKNKKEIEQGEFSFFTRTNAQSQEKGVRAIFHPLRLKAFTLAEMMVVMLILSIVLAASMPIITKRVKTDKASSSIWKYLADNIHIYYGSGDTEGVIIGNNSKSTTDGKLYINSKNPSAMPHMVFGIGGTYAGKLNFPSTTAIELGNGGSSSGFGAIAVGENAKASSQDTASGAAIAIGINSEAIGYGTVVGQSAFANKSICGTAVGNNARALGERSIAIGHDTEASALGAISIGSSCSGAGINTRASGLYSTSLGYGASASGAASTALGYKANVSGSLSTALGCRANANGVSSIAIGNGANASGTESTALGKSVASSIYSTAQGHDANASGDDSTALGVAAKATGDDSIALGAFAYSRGDDSTALGHNAGAESNSNALGNYANASGSYSNALGYSAKASGDSSTALGWGTTASEDYSMALGYYANASGKYSTALGYRASTTNDNEIMLGTSETTVTYYNLSKVSDKRLKDVGKEFTSSLEKIENIKAYYYTFSPEKEKLRRVLDSKLECMKSNEYKKEHNLLKRQAMILKAEQKAKKDYDKYSKNGSRKLNVGVMAQDLQKVFPNSVHKDADGYLTIDKEEMFYAMINSIKELDKMFKSLKSEITSKISNIEKQMNQVQKDTKNLRKENDNLKLKISKLEKESNDLKKRDKNIENRLRNLEKRR